MESREKQARQETSGELAGGRAGRGEETGGSSYKERIEWKEKRDKGETVRSDGRVASPCGSIDREIST